MSKVSVLLTCYNHLAFLPEALASIRSQTAPVHEIIAIDDGSTDGTREWLKENAADCKLIFNETNVGTYGSLNRALKEAAGEFLAILNDDDVWASNKLERQLAIMKSHPKVGLVHTNGGFIDGEGKPIPGSPLGFDFPKTESGNVLLALHYQNKIIASAALVRSECFQRLGGFNESYFGSGDWEMWLRIASQYEVGYVSEPLTYYRVHGGNASHKLDRIWKDDQMLREWLRTRYEELNSYGFEPAAVTHAKAHNEACLGTIYALNGMPSESRKSYAASIRLCPGRIKSYVRWLMTFAPSQLFRRTIRL